MMACPGIKALRRNILSLILGMGAVLAGVEECRSEVIASDTASDPAYADGWQGLHGTVPVETGMDNGGRGFLPWDFEADEAFWDPAKSPYSQPHFIDTG